jgi:methylated-DNA-[protein]-cysteine S-methyltransferase
MTFETMRIESPVGKLRLVANGDALAAILWEVEKPHRVRLGPLVAHRDNAVLIETAAQLADYFSGKRTSFDVKLDFHGTDFQKKVWRALLTIPFGETRTYGDIAAQIGCPSAVRAVGAANGRNPISIIAPCHRVIGSTGALTGFAGGIEAKAVLLAVEGHRVESARVRRHLEPGRR